MKKKLTKVFANKIEKTINNNEKIYNSNKQDNQQIIENKQETIKTEKKIIPKKVNEEKTIHQKINEIINSRNYIYKIPVKIRTENDEIITKIIGKNKNNVITIDNKLIKIETIQNIEIYEE